MSAGTGHRAVSIRMDCVLVSSSFNCLFLKLLQNVKRNKKNVIILFLSGSNLDSKVEILVSWVG